MESSRFNLLLVGLANRFLQCADGDLLDRTVEPIMEWNDDWGGAKRRQALPRPSNPSS